MKLLVFVVAALVASVLAEKTEDLLRLQGKRQSNEKQSSGELTQTALKYLAQAQKSAPQNYNLQGLSYDPQALQYSQQALQYSPQSAAAPPHVTFGFSPQHQQQQQQQQQIQYVSQPLTYEQPKTAPLPQKLAPIHFSPASEVSSFKFTSPLVTYSNHGVLSQLVGKAPEIVTGQHPGGRAIAAAPSASPYSAAPQKSAQAAAPQPQQYQQYTEEPQFDYSSAQKLAYSQAPQQQYQYIQVPQQLAYSGQPQKLAYSQGASSQQPQSQFLYDQGPQQFASSNPNTQQVSYSGAQAQNAHLAPSQQQQFVYSFATPQASQSNTRSVYSVPSFYQSSHSGKHGSSHH